MSDLPPNDPMTPAPSTPGALPTTTSAVGSPVMGDAVDVEKNKIMGVLAYLGILVLVPILAAKDSPFAKFHANQGLVLLITSIVGWIPLTILAFIPFLGCVAGIILMLWWLGVLVMMILGIVNAATGKMAPLPVIGQFKILK